MAEQRVKSSGGGTIRIKLERAAFADGRALQAEGERQAKAKAGSRKLVGTMGVKADGETVTLTFPLVKDKG